MATTILRTRIDRTRARDAGQILARLGLTPGDAVNMFLAQVIARRGIPFAVEETGYAYARGEYGLTPGEMDSAEKRVARGIARERKAGTIKTIHSADDLR
jgi:antitoxin component of RelBE/YafQ-DinJ toxin-antitoxin module